MSECGVESSHVDYVSERRIDLAIEDCREVVSHYYGIETQSGSLAFR